MVSTGPPVWLGSSRPVAASVAPVALAQQSPPPARGSTPGTHRPAPRRTRAGGEHLGASSGLHESERRYSRASHRPPARRSRARRRPAGCTESWHRPRAESAASAKPSGLDRLARAAARGRQGGWRPAGPPDALQGKGKGIDSARYDGRSPVTRSCRKCYISCPGSVPISATCWVGLRTACSMKCCSRSIGDVLKRENRYYDALKPDASGGAEKPARRRVLATSAERLLVKHRG